MLSGLKTLARSGLENLLRTRRGKNFMFRAMSGPGKYMLSVEEDHRIIYTPSEFIGRMIYETGNFNRAMTSEIVAFCRAEGRPGPVPEGGVLLEIGANIGTQTLYANLAHPFARTIAVEPDPDNVDLLRMNIQINGLQDRVAVYPNAVSEQAMTLTLYRHGLNSGAGTLRDNRAALEGTEAFLDKSTEVPVEAMRGDDILADAGVDPGDLAMVWIDVEGHEASVLRSMPAILDSDAALVMEYSPEWLSDADRRDIKDRVMAHRGRLFLYEDGIKPISAPDFAALETQADIIALK